MVKVIIYQNSCERSGNTGRFPSLTKLSALIQDDSLTVEQWPPNPLVKVQILVILPVHSMVIAAYMLRHTDDDWRNQNAVTLADGENASRNPK